MADTGLEPKCRWLTPPEVCEAAEKFFGGLADLDPFWDPNGFMKARQRCDIREGQDGYDAIWKDRVWLNGPYPARFNRRTAEKAAMSYALQRHGTAELLMLCPATVGGDWWRDFVWPYANVVAWLGRLSFVASVDVYNAKTGLLVCKAGQVAKGNRTEIALVGYTPRIGAFLDAFKAWPCTVIDRRYHQKSA